MFHYLIRYTSYQDHFNNFSLPEDRERGRQCKQQYFTATGCHLKQKNALVLFPMNSNKLCSHRARVRTKSHTHLSNQESETLLNSDTKINTDKQTNRQRVLLNRLNMYIVFFFLFESTNVVQTFT